MSWTAKKIFKCAFWECLNMCLFKWQNTGLGRSTLGNRVFFLKGPVSRDFLPFMGSKTLLGPPYEPENGLANFFRFRFEKILSNNACSCRKKNLGWKRLIWIHFQKLYIVDDEGMHAIFQLCTRITLQKQKSSQNLFIPNAMYKVKPTKIRVQKLVTMSIYDPVSILFHPTVSLLYELTQLVCRKRHLNSIYLVQLEESFINFAQKN